MPEWLTGTRLRVEKLAGEWALIAALVLVMKYNNQDKLQLVHQPLLIKEWLTVKSDY